LFFCFLSLHPGLRGKNKKEEAFFLSERRGRDVLHGE